MTNEPFQKAYKALNTAQKQAVDAIDGPVMVVAGPGTGKTQVLTLRIANILENTDTEANGVLCLTFTRSGVSAMQDRLETYIGQLARNVTITTFHSFAISLIEKNYSLLDFHSMPSLLDDAQAVVLVDELLENSAWTYLRPRTDPTKYFNDLKSLISLLKRESLQPADFLAIIEAEIKQLESDPSSISTRGATKGELKKEVEKNIDSLNRTREVVMFYEQYEAIKHDHNLMDYDDVLTYAVDLVEQFENVRADVRENYLYVLVDEHQDSSGIQNRFLKAVWAEVEQPNIFVVGDDRQLIYGFSGANIDYFNEFKTAFGKAQKIVLTENYRSTTPILNLADDLLKSSITTDALHSNKTGTDKIKLSEYTYNRDEIIGAGLYFKKLIESGTKPNECAILLPKNRHVRQAVTTLRSMGIPVVSEQSVSLLSLPQTQSLLRVLGILVDPYNGILLNESLLDATSGVPAFVAYTFIKNTKKSENLTIDDMVENNKASGLFAESDSVAMFGTKLKTWVDALAGEKVSHIVSVVGNELLIDQAKNHEELLRSIEVVRSFIHAALAWEEKPARQSHSGGNITGSLKDFLTYIQRLTTYGNHIEVAALGKDEGVHVMTLHKSKGLEYDHVWVGHMNEEILMGSKHTVFTLPEKVKQSITERDTITAKRELYVAITRAKQYCTISYAQMRDDGVELSQANIIADLEQKPARPDEAGRSGGHFVRTNATENEQTILAENARLYAVKPQTQDEVELLEQVKKFVHDRFAETKISVSMLNNFFECTWKWYFRNFLKLPEVKGVSLALGSAVHNTIEFILKEKSLPSDIEIKKFIMQSLKKEGVTNVKEIARLGKDAHKAVTGWVDGFYNTLSTDRESERALSYRDKMFPNLSIFGKVDLTERTGAGVVITDFKTGSSKTAGVIEKLDDEGRLSSYMRQLAMYAYLVDRTEGNTPDQLRLLFLEEDTKPARPDGRSGGNKNKLYSTHITGEQIDLLLRDISDYQTWLTDGTWVNRPCNAVSYGGGVCEYCARMERIMGKE